MQIPNKYTQKLRIPNKYIIILAVIGFAAQFSYESVYVIKPGEQILLSRFGKIEKGPIKNPGYHIKLYRFDQVVRYPIEPTMIRIVFIGCPPKAKAFHADMNFTISDPISFYHRVYHRESLPKFIANMLNENYCTGSDPTNKKEKSTIPNFIENEMKKYGITVNNINN